MKVITIFVELLFMKYTSLANLTYNQQAQIGDLKDSSSPKYIGNLNKRTEILRLDNH